MSVQNTYKGPKTTILGLLLIGAMIFSWVKGTQVIDAFSLIIAASGVYLLFRPDDLINAMQGKLKKWAKTPPENNNCEQN